MSAWFRRINVSLLYLNNNASHIIGTWAIALRVVNIFADNLVEHIANNFAWVFTSFAGLDRLVHQVDAPLRCETVPDTVAGNDHKFIIGGDGFLPNFGYASYHLGLDADFVIHLILHVAESAGKRQNTSDTAVLNETTCSFDSFQFANVVRLVILRHLDCFDTSGQHTSTIAWVSTVDSVFGD